MSHPASGLVPPNETPAYANAGTKFSDLETMRKILKSLVLSAGEVPKVARNHFPLH